ncbi:hypothetical protein AOA61_26915 [Pseudomonas sp. 2995-1]|nr:hypothetical protein AOA61_26915 [Pseudomonas sp. 2995-1]
MGSMDHALLTLERFSEPFTNFMFSAARLRHWIFYFVDEVPVISAAPLTVQWIERYFLAAFDLYRKDAMTSMSDQKVAFTILFISEPVGTQPRARIEDMESVVQHFT